MQYCTILYPNSYTNIYFLYMKWRKYTHKRIKKKISCLVRKAPVTSPIETSYKASPQIQQLANTIYSLNNNGRSDTFVSVLHVCLPITRLLILLLRNHGFWIAEKPIILHLIHNFSHTLHHHLFQMLICPQAQLRPSHVQAQLNSMTISL